MLVVFWQLCLLFSWLGFLFTLYYYFSNILFFIAHIQSLLKVCREKLSTLGWPAWITEPDCLAYSDLSSSSFWCPPLPRSMKWSKIFIGMGKIMVLKKERAKYLVNLSFGCIIQKRSTLEFYNLNSIIFYRNIFLPIVLSCNAAQSL